MHHVAWLHECDWVWWRMTATNDGTKQASSHCHKQRWRKVDGSWGAEPVWGMCDIHGVRLHVGQRFVADDFGEISTQARYSAARVPQHTACAESKPATTRSWGWRGSGVVSSLLGVMARKPSKLDFWRSLRSEPGEGLMATRPSELHFWLRLQSEPGCSLWPAGLQKLVLGKQFNQNLDHISSPARLQSLTLDYDFNQSLDAVSCPANLQKLYLRFADHKSLQTVSWPAGLQSLTLGYDFNHGLSNVSWPAGLQTLTLEYDSIDLWTISHGQEAFKTWLSAITLIIVRA